MYRDVERGTDRCIYIYVHIYKRANDTKYDIQTNHNTTTIQLPGASVGLFDCNFQMPSTHVTLSLNLSLDPFHFNPFMP